MAGTRRVVNWLTAAKREWSRLWNGEYDQTTLRSVPSWGVSFLLHALLLLILAFIVRYRPASRPDAAFESSIIDTDIGDVTSLVPAKRSGDPFTEEQKPEPALDRPGAGAQWAADGRPAPPGIAHALRAHACRARRR